MNLVGEWNELDKNQVQTPGESLESEHRSETDTPSVKRERWVGE